MSTSQERNRMIYKEIKSNLGPCMITFSIPLLIPGITLTLVAFGDEPSIPIYGSLHILGIFVLVLAILMFIIGCVFKCSFQTIRITPVEEIHRVVTTHDKLNQNINNSLKNTRTISVIKNGSHCDIRDIYQNNINHKLNEPSTSSSIPNNSNNNNNSSASTNGSSGSLVTRTDSSQSHHTTDTPACDSTHNQNTVTHEQYSKEIKHKLDPYPLGRLPSLDLKHTKYSYSSQDKPDEEMSIVDETNCTSPEIQTTNKTHFGDLPDINQERRIVLLSDERSYDTNSFTSTDSITGHIIRTNKGDYLERESEHFGY